MKTTFSLGRVAGVRLGVHWSVLIGVLVVALGLARRFPDAYPDRQPWQYWLVGLPGALVFLLSLLAHELSYALIARRDGVDVARQGRLPVVRKTRPSSASLGSGLSAAASRVG